MNAFDRALSLGAQASARISGQSIVYRAYNVSIEIPDAVLGSTSWETTDLNGGRIRAQSTDWLIFVSRLVHDNQPIEPTPGHQIVHTVNGLTRTYEVQTMGSEPCYRYSGSTRDRYRIHVREIANE